MRKLFVIIIVAALTACGGGNPKQAASGADTLYNPRYAAGFTILSSGESSVIAIRNPWQGARDTQMQLFLSRNGEAAPDGFAGVVAEAPLKRVVCMSSSYIAFIDALGEIDAVKGVSGGRYITNATIRERYARGEVRDVGYDSQMNYETLAVLDPDLVLIYGVAGRNSQLTAKMDELGIKYLYIGDYVENSPLGKAEWFVAFGEMFDKRAEAEKMFGNIVESYDATRDKVENYYASLSQAAGSTAAGSTTPLKPVVMLNAPYRDTWYVPGDRSYIVRLVNDAGGEYVYAGVSDSEETRPVSIESAYISAARSQVWLNPGQAATLRDVKSLNPRFADIPAVASGRVFNCTARTTPDGGSDFWESGAVRPDVVLKDMVKMLCPDALPDHELYYFKQMR